MKRQKECLHCGIDISHMGNKKYCTIKCLHNDYESRYGFKLWSKLCKCGCGSYLISKMGPIWKDYIKGHNPDGKKHIEVKTKLILCELCGSESKMLHKYPMPTFTLKLCKVCYTKIFDMSLEGD